MLEVIATSIEDAIKIEKNGGNRIELVSALTEGGLTPSFALIKYVVGEVKIPVNIMIRPHSKSFVYSKEDLKVMKEDITVAEDLKANGIVLGTLNLKNEINEEDLVELLSVSRNLEVTFHRAIDEVKDLIAAVKILKKYSQIKRILTSGGRGKIENNTDIIAEMIKESGENIKVLIGGGLNKDNINSILKKTRAEEVHIGTAARKDSSNILGIEEAALMNLSYLLSL
jgi:copper homeostasis protein